MWVNLIGFGLHAFTFDNLWSKCLVSCTHKCSIFVQCIQTELRLSFGTKTVMTHAYKTKTSMYKRVFNKQCWWIVLCWTLIINILDYSIHHTVRHSCMGIIMCRIWTAGVDAFKYCPVYLFEKVQCLCKYCLIKIQVTTGQLIIVRSVGYCWWSHCNRFQNTNNKLLLQI